MLFIIIILAAHEDPSKCYHMCVIRLLFYQILNKTLKFSSITGRSIKDRVSVAWLYVGNVGQSTEKYKKKTKYCGGDTQVCLWMCHAVSWEAYKTDTNENNYRKTHKWQACLVDISRWRWHVQQVIIIINGRRFTYKRVDCRFHHWTKRLNKCQLFELSC